MGLFGSNQSIGVDIGHASIKVVALTIGKNPRVTGFTEINVDPKELEKEGLENPTEVANRLKEALKLATPRPIHGKDAYVSVRETAVFRKILEVPRNINEAELPTVVRAAVVEYLPDDIDSLELDYQPLPTPKESPMQQVMVVAVSKKSIEQYLNLCELAGLNVMAIGTKSAALLRAVAGPRVTEPIVVVNVGSDTSTIVLCADHVVWVASTVTGGGNMLKDMATGEIDQDRVPEKLRRLTNSLADELDHVVKFYANREGGSNTTVKEVRVTGSGSLLVDGLDQLLAEESGLKVVYGQSPVPLPEKCDRRFMGALGSALYPMFDAL